MFQIQAFIDGVKTLKNNSLKITIETQDTKTLTSNEMAELFKLNDKHVWVAFKEQSVKVEDLDIKESNEFKSDKSPSQRLRSVLYVYWEKYKPTDDFDSFYRKKMEDFINLIKDKLD